ncbi:MAG: PTS transporter subunit EIIA [Eubacterium sp.]|nr:PTS transporter subunit EIIA [Eubacterium sp.]
MLSERGLQIVEKLIDNNRTPVTSKMLAVYLGVSERSVKTYINEVSDFCKVREMKLERKPGIGFVADFTEEQIEQFQEMKINKKIFISQRQRIGYIMYILLSGWDNYTLSLFSDELNVSKKVISDDINFMSKEIRKYNIHINRVSGYGVFITGDEFSIRKAMKSYCRFPIGDKNVTYIYDNRLSIEEEELWINNWGQDNFEKAIEIVHYIEEKYKGVYTDYSFKMLIQYLCIQLFRIRMGNVITEAVIENDDIISNLNVVNDVEDILLKMDQVQMNPYERQYIDVLFASATLQVNDGTFNTITLNDMEEKCKKISKDMAKYISEILNLNLLNNELLIKSLEDFLPSSMIRTKYGIEVRNPFLKDIREMYSGIFATCFTLEKFYEQYSGKIPTDHEISFLALFVGGALHRNEKTIKAVLIGTSGIAAANIVARKIENKIESVKIVAILSSEKIMNWDDYEFDIVLSMMPNFEYGNKVVYISPIISKADEKKIRDKCFEVLSHPEVKKEGFSNMIDVNHIMFVKDKRSKEAVLKDACNILYNHGYVKKEFFESVINRENIEPTELGNGVAIPHGLPENVCEPKVMVIKLKYPVNWGNKKVDIIFLLALNFNNVDTTKAFFHDFSKILESEDNLKKIRKTETIVEMEKTLKEKLHWSR